MRRSRWDESIELLAPPGGSDAKQVEEFLSRPLGEKDFPSAFDSTGCTDIDIAVTAMGSIDDPVPVSKAARKVLLPQWTRRTPRPASPSEPPGGARSSIDSSPPTFASSPRDSRLRAYPRLLTPTSICSTTRSSSGSSSFACFQLGSSASLRNRSHAWFAHHDLAPAENHSALIVTVTVRTALRVGSVFGPHRSSRSFSRISLNDSSPAFITNSLSATPGLKNHFFSVDALPVLLGLSAATSQRASLCDSSP